MHYHYSAVNKGFDRLRLRIYLRRMSDRGRFSKSVGNVTVIGIYDDLRILRELSTNKKYTSLIEIKTTSKKYLWSREEAMAVRQLQLYMWILKEYLEAFGFPLWKRSYVQVYDQHTGRLMKIIPVEYDPYIEDWIRDVVESFEGTLPITVPPFKFCKMCPNNVKKACSWYQSRKDKYDKKKYEI